MTVRTKFEVRSNVRRPLKQRQNTGIADIIGDRAFPVAAVLPVLRSVCPNKSLPHPLCVFSKVISRLSSSDVPSHDSLPQLLKCLHSATCHFGHLNRSIYLLTYLLLGAWVSSAVVCKFSAKTINHFVMFHTFTVMLGLDLGLDLNAKVFDLCLGAQGLGRIALCIKSSF